ncbi:hypothetical protein F5Y19DRAFT_275720 [Xylariaceae sp. FL1651]|nr:hypothetical protein F5Y19DRAFT_275720 [Xylariaceae sp. FL1651]
MKYSIVILAAFAALCSGIPKGKPKNNKMPACSSKSPTPCRCPAGTQYLQCVTVGIIGASAPDVEKLINDFYQISWQLGAMPYKTKGPDNKPGSIRSVRYPIVPTGIEDVDEKLTSRFVKRDGSFIQMFEQVQPTIPYPDGNGVFAGFWGTIEGEATFRNETRVTFSNYACETAHIRSFAGFHEMALKNASDILNAQGKLHGKSIAPFSAQSFE